MTIPDRMWFATARLGHTLEERAPGDTSAFAHWLNDGRLYLNPWPGRPDEFETRLRHVQPGDAVFAYEPGIGIRAIGRVSDPLELADVGPNALFPRDGSIVLAIAVDWNTTVTRTVGQVSEASATGSSAFKSCGPGTRFYRMAVEMLREAHDRHWTDPDAGEAAAIKRIASSRAYSPKTKVQLGQARIGQGRFRAAVLAREPHCRVTGTLQARYLVASHIKPWAVCTGDEHLDGANGLMLAPHVDHLFDTGLISFEDNGDLVLASSLDPQVLQAWHIDAGANVGRFAPDQARYLAYHRQFVLGQPRPRRRRNLVGDVPTGAAFDDLLAAGGEQ
ncbi:HNH endonuclease [Massilia brevitalea]|uniref:HNH endonuclease n=1 Tax=Massilia brevitalea TaxID=442526 RepID=UPI002739BF1A|nr:HNH endonuclease [Massilia brevitalea]